MSYKRALITGASSGIGEATAEALAAKGISLILLARRDARLTEVKRKIEKRFSVEVFTASVDVQSRDQIESFVAKNRTLLESVDVLVNNAGLAKGTEKMQEADPADWDAMIDTNVKGLLFMTRALLPQMIKNNQGHIINLGSVAGRWVYPGGGIYCASKFAVRAISEGLRMDLMGTQLRVTNIEPGMVETEFSQVRFAGNTERAKAVYKGMQALTAADIAETIGWCLDRPKHVNIQELVIFPTDQAAIQQIHRRD